MPAFRYRTELPIPSPVYTPNPGSALPTLLKHEDDSWALAYLNVAHVQSILEAIDDDGTGFVSIKEVNTFVSSRPTGWTYDHFLFLFNSSYLSAL